MVTLFYYKEVFKFLNQEHQIIQTIIILFSISQLEESLLYYRVVTSCLL